VCVFIYIQYIHTYNREREAGQPGKDFQDRIARTGCQERDVRTGLLGQNSQTQGRTEKKGQPKKEN
jgi:hypothetical protein